MKSQLAYLDSKPILHLGSVLAKVIDVASKAVTDVPERQQEVRILLVATAISEIPEDFKEEYAHILAVICEVFGITDRQLRIITETLYGIGERNSAEKRIQEDANIPSAGE